MTSSMAVNLFLVDASKSWVVECSFNAILSFRFKSYGLKSRIYAFNAN